MLLFTSCQAAKPTEPPASSPTPAYTETPAASVTPTATATSTSPPTLTPEPEWYQKLDPSYGVLKYQYAEVTDARARVYSLFSDAVANNGNFGYLPNFPAYVAYSATRTADDGQVWYLVNYGWISGAYLRLLTPSTFSGILLTREVSFRFGWVLGDTQSSSLGGEPVRAYKRYDLVHEVPSAQPRDGFVSIGADEWLPVSSVALASPQVPADAGQNTCRFIYVDLGTEVLSVYDGCKLVFATLVSSGKNSWTFEGRFAILYKVPYSSITPPEWSTSDYYIEGVPFFMTYAGNFGFHGAYWHDDFGSPGSHGCINLAPADAQWLYAWAGIGERVIISPGDQ